MICLTLPVSKKYASPLPVTSLVTKTGHVQVMCLGPSAFLVRKRRPRTRIKQSATLKLDFELQTVISHSLQHHQLRHGAPAPHGHCLEILKSQYTVTVTLQHRCTWTLDDFGIFGRFQKFCRNSSACICLADERHLGILESQYIFTSQHECTRTLDVFRTEHHHNAMGRDPWPEVSQTKKTKRNTRMPWDGIQWPAVSQGRLRATAPYFPKVFCSHACSRARSRP